MKCVAVTLLAAIGAASCLSLDKAHPEQSFYVLELEPPEPAVGDPIDAVLMVRPFRAAEPYGDVQFIYRVGPDQLETDFYHLFLTPPDRMIRHATESWLRASNSFRGIVDGASVADADYALDAVVTMLRGDYSDAESPLAVLTMQVTVISSGAAESLVLQKEYSSHVAIDRDAAPELVAGWRHGLQQILAELAGDLPEVCVQK